MEQRLAAHVGRASRHVLQFVRVLYLYSAMHTENHCQDFAAPRPCSHVNVLCSCAGFLCACVLRVPGRQELAGAPTRPARPLAVTSLPSGGAGSHARGRRAADRPIGIPRRAAPPLRSRHCPLIMLPAKMTWSRRQLSAAA